MPGHRGQAKKAKLFERSGLEPPYKNYAVERLECLRAKIVFALVAGFSRKTPTVDPPPETRAIPSELHRVNVPRERSRYWTDEAWRRRGEQEGERSCCAPRAQRLPF